jgi:hypothetical protein
MDPIPKPDQGRGLGGILALLTVADLPFAARAVVGSPTDGSPSGRTLARA